MSDQVHVYFRRAACDLEAAARALERYRIDVDRRGDRLVASTPGSPQFRIALDAAPHVAEEAADIGAGTPHAAGMAACDARFVVGFDDLDEVLDEINTLIEIQAALPEVSGGYLFLTWNGHLDGPGST